VTDDVADYDAPPAPPAAAALVSVPALVLVPRDVATLRAEGSFVAVRTMNSHVANGNDNGSSSSSITRQR
jgi:hypothetical protein